MTRYKKFTVQFRMALLATTLCGLSGYNSAYAQQTDHNGLEAYPNIIGALHKYGYDRFSVNQLDPMTVGSIDQQPALSQAAKVTARFPVSEGELTLRGEFDSKQWPVFLDEKGAASGMKISVAYQNAVSVLPETSRISIWVNGVEIQKIPIQSPNRNAMVEANVDAKYLNLGENQIEIRAKHRHRVDCSVDAAYELWTSIDLNKSQLEYVVDKNNTTTSKSLAAVSTDLTGTVPVYLISSNEFSNPNLLALTQLVAVNMPHKLSVKSLNLETDDTQNDGVFVFSGTRSQLLANKFIQERFSSAAIDRALASANEPAVFVRSTDGQSILAARIEGTFNRISSLGHQNNGQDYHISNGDESVSFKDLGFEAEEFTGRLFSNKLRFYLPDDFYPADYDNIILHLYGAYAAGLDSSSRLITRINGVSRVSLPFGESDGEMLENKRLKLPLSFFRPGLNEVDIVANLQSAEDSKCYLKVESTENPRFYLSEKSFFKIPQLARMQQFPDVRSFLFGKDKFRNQTAKPLKFELVSTDQDSLDTAYQFVMNWAQASGVVRPITFKPAIKNRLHGGRPMSRIVFGSFAQMAKKFQKPDLGVNFATLAANSREFANRNIDEITTASIRPEGGALAFNETDYNLSDDTNNAKSGSLKQFFEEGGRHSSQKEPSVFNELFSSTIPSKKDQENENGFNSLDVSVVQAVSDGMATTFIGYANALPKQERFDSVFKQSSYGNDPLTLVGLDTQSQNIIGKKPDNSVSIGSPTTSFTNQRLLLAGWLSNNPWVFALLAMLFTLCLGMTTTGSVNRTKRSNQKASSNETA